MENNRVPCQGFLEKLVLSLKSIFLEEDILKILIKRSGDEVVYTHRKCREFSFSNVCEPCRGWFEGLQSIEGKIKTQNSIKLELKEMGQYDNFLEQEMTEDFKSYENADIVRHQSVIKTTKDYKEEMTVLPSAELDDYLDNIENIHEDLEDKNSGDDLEWEPSSLLAKKDKRRIKRKYVKKIKKEEGFDEIHPCLLCQKRFKTPKKLQMHEKRFHDMHQKVPVVCDICGKTCKNSTLLKFHVIAHEKPKEDCDICGLSVKSVKTHKINVHGDKDIKPFICEKCGDRFRTKERHDYHMRKHDGLKPFKCKTCQKSYTGRSGATRCEKMHKGPETYRYTCTFCGFKVMDKEKLRNHIRTHTREKPFKCPLCNYRAARRDYMRKHLASLHKDRTVEQIEHMFPDLFKAEVVPVILDEKDAVGYGVKSEEPVQVKPEVVEMEEGGNAIPLQQIDFKQHQIALTRSPLATEGAGHEDRFSTNLRGGSGGSPIPLQHSDLKQRQFALTRSPLSTNDSGHEDSLSTQLRRETVEDSLSTQLRRETVEVEKAKEPPVIVENVMYVL